MLRYLQLCNKDYDVTMGSASIKHINVVMFRISFELHYLNKKKLFQVYSFYLHFEPLDQQSVCWKCRTNNIKDNVRINNAKQNLINLTYLRLSFLIYAWQCLERNYHWAKIKLVGTYSRLSSCLSKCPTILEPLISK